VGIQVTKQTTRTVLETMAATAMPEQFLTAGMRTSPRCCLILIRLVGLNLEMFGRVVKHELNVLLIVMLEYMTVQPAAPDVSDEEHIADNMASGVGEVASWVVELEDGDSSSGDGYQGDDESDDKLTK
jgi:hypothetical protein